LWTHSERSVPGANNDKRQPDANKLCETFVAADLRAKIEISEGCQYGQCLSDPFRI
jgi:hypothetical protein